MAFSPSISVGQGIWDSGAGMIHQGGAAAGNEVVNTAITAAAGSAMNIAFLSGVGALGGIGVPVVLLSGMMAKNIANGAADRMWSHVSAVGVGARRCLNLAAASMDEAGNLDLSRLENLNDKEFAAAAGERSPEPTKLKESVLSRIERVTYCIRRRVFGQSKDALKHTRPTVDRLKARHEKNLEIVMKNRMTGMESAQKLITALGQRGAEGAFKTLQTFMESQAFQDASKRYMALASGGIAQGILNEVQTPEATRGLDHVGKHVAKGATKGAIEEINAEPETAAKALATLSSGITSGACKELLDLEVPCREDEPQTESGKKKALPGLSNSIADGLPKHAVDATAAMATFLGAYQTVGYGQSEGWSARPTQGWMARTLFAVTVLGFQAVDMLKRQKTGEATPYIPAQQLLPFITPVPEMALHSLAKIPENSKKSASLGALGGTAGAWAGKAIGNMIGAFNAGPLGRIAGETAGAIAGGLIGGAAGTLFGSRYFTDTSAPQKKD